MSFIDTIALPLFVGLFGSAALLLVGALIVLWLIPKMRLLVAQRRAVEIGSQSTAAHLELSREVVNQLILETSKNPAFGSLLPESLMEDVLKLHEELNADSDRIARALMGGRR